MPVDAIDVWDVETFDIALLSDLRDHGDLIESYIKTDREIFDEHEKSDHIYPRRDNPFADHFIRYKERGLLPLMEARTIRAWHYTRMTDAEVLRIRQGGIIPSNLATIRARLDLMVAEGAFDQATADRLYAESPFHNESFGIRSGMFWMTSHPVEIDDSGVELLLGLWGGESVAFVHHRGAMREPLSQIGRGRVLEVAVPMSATNRAYSAVDGVISGYAASVGLRYGHSSFDVYAKTPLPPTNILAIRSDGEENFASTARAYPARFTVTKPPPYRFE